MKKSGHIAVIGGGLAGMTTASRLTKSGHRVDLFEKNQTLGGKAGEIRQEGFRFDTGPSLLTLKPVIDEFFSFMGETHHQPTTTRLDTITRYFFSSGNRFDAHADPERLQWEVQKLWPADAKAFQKFSKHTASLYDLAGELFMKNPIHEWRSLLQWKHLPVLLQLFKLDAFRSMHASHKSFFKSPELRQFFGRFATYNGSSPYRAPATLNLIAHVELSLGAWTIRGGMRALANAIRLVAQKHGVKIHEGSEVSEILHNGKVAAGLRVNGDTLPFDAVVVASDAITAQSRLLKELPFDTGKPEPSLSGLVFLWGVRGRRQELLHHNVFFSSDYQKEFSQLFNEKVFPSDPTVYAAITAKSDPGDAPAECENWFVMVNAPPLGRDGSMAPGLESVRKRVLTRLGQSGLDIEKDIVFEKRLTPMDFFTRDGSYRGAIYGLSSHGLGQAFLRPSNRSHRLAGLYFAGGSAHPGGGVPLVMESARIVADLIAREAA